MTDPNRPSGGLVPDEGPLSPDLWFNAVRQFMEERIPFNQFLGVRVDQMSRGLAVLRLPFRPAFVGDPFRPALHGGTISMLIDTAGGAAVWSEIDRKDRVSTIDMRVDYLRPAALVDTWAEAKVVRLGNRVGVARIQVWQEEAPGNASDEAQAGEGGGRRMVAEGTGVYAIRRAER